MSLRCLLFSSDEGTAAPILQVLTALGVAGEHCSEAVATVDKVTHENFQIVIIDWDQQPEASLLLAAARERKAVERPITLAIVSDDVSVPQALQAGANSILRKPIVANHVRDTLTTARDLLRSKQESAANASQAAAAAAAAAAGAASTVPSSVEPGQEKSKLRAGEFLHSAPPTPGGQFETETDVHESLKPFSVEPVNPLTELEPTAASVAHGTPASDPPPLQPEPVDPRSGEAKGLAWYLKTRAGALPPNPVQSSSSATSSATPPPAMPELLSYDQPTSYSPSHSPSSLDAASNSAPEPKRSLQRLPDRAPEPRIETKPEPRPEPKHEQKKEAELFAYMAGESSESSAETSHSPSRLKRPIIGALVLAACAIGAAPQAPWHSQLRSGWTHAQLSLRMWLNPQPVTPAQAPAVHEDFARAGDEYKLPVAETIPDATTDPSQIQVLPVVDPTIKKGNPLGGNAEPGQGDGTGAVPVEQTPPSATSTPENQPPASPVTVQPNIGSMTPVQPSAVSTTGATTPAPVASLPPRSDAPTVVSQPVPSAPVRPSPTKTQEAPSLTPGNVPSSLKSHIVSMTPDASGNKAPETAMPTIEPVAVAEASERTLLTDQPAIGYPASARGQQGTVILQVLIGRDGTVQDAKFMQGSLAFARAAIDGVRQWKFKPYAMNGRPVSVQTQLTMSFKPGQ